MKSPASRQSPPNAEDRLFACGMHQPVGDDIEWCGYGRHWTTVPVRYNWLCDECAWLSHLAMHMPWNL